MTILAAYTDGVTTWIGSDLAGTMENGYIKLLKRKWLGAEGWWYGHGGDLRVANLIERNATPLLRDVKDPAEFIDRLKRLYDDNGIKCHFDDNRGAGCYGNEGILVRAGAVWGIGQSLALLPADPDAVMCRGVAEHVAEAAAWGYQRAQPGADPHKLIAVALEAAAHFNVWLRGVWQETVVRVAADT
jgi:hypothetical protein